MKANCFSAVLFLLSMTLCCCSQEKAEEHNILARINDYNLTVDRFQHQLAAELELEKDFKLTNEAKKEFLEELIRKELLIQEAKKLRLDTRDSFIRAIERYWESTLIRDLIELKSKEIQERTYVSQEEIERRYKEMKQSDKTLSPLEELQEEISKTLQEEKKSQMLEEWISELRKKANIKVNEQLL